MKLAPIAPDVNSERTRAERRPSPAFAHLSLRKSERFYLIACRLFFGMALINADNTSYRAFS